MNQLIFGDNLNVLKSKIIKDESIDLIYLDPPFNSKKVYNILYKTPDKDKENSQVEAFLDTWSWGDDDEKVFEEVGRLEDKSLYTCLRSFRDIMGESDMMAYLTNMSIRIYFLNKKLKKDGSMYLHCDPTASHYLKMVMDTIIGNKNFRNEIIWERSHPHNDAKRYGNNTDRILFYAKSNKSTWNKQFTPLGEDYIKSHYKHTDDDGRKYRLGPLDAKSLSGGGYEYEWNNRYHLWRVPKKEMEKLHKEKKLHYTSKGLANRKLFLDERDGIPLQSLWKDIHFVQGSEDLGYPTQKPIKLLERIINASSKENDLVLDPFCGCGTTIHAAEKLKRNWIGIDITHLATGLVKKRLINSFPKVKFKSNGIPTNLSSAIKLRDFSEKNPKLYYEFQYWANSLIPGVRNNPVKGSDNGVDGTYWVIEGKDNKGYIYKKGIVSIKSGKNVSVTMVDELYGAMKKNNAFSGILVTLEKPKSTMIQAAAKMGLFKALGKNYQKVQCVSIEELLNGVMPKIPITLAFETADTSVSELQQSLFEIN